MIPGRLRAPTHITQTALVGRYGRSLLLFLESSRRAPAVHEKSSASAELFWRFHGAHAPMMMGTSAAEQMVISTPVQNE